MKTTFILLLSILILSGCSGKNSAENESSTQKEAATGSLVAEVNRVHDEVMPRTGDIYKLKKRLQQLDTASGTNPETKAKISAAIRKLDSAYDGMMKWMHEYKPEEHEANGEEARKYLENELVKINRVREDMLTSIEEAKTVAGQ